MDGVEVSEVDRLALVGERTVPGVPSENYWFRRHEAAYDYVLPLIAGRVVEVGCGEGYGTARLAARADAIVGVDYDAAAVAHAAATYPGARFVRANLAALPLHSRCVDAVVSLQVIEHVWDHAQYLRECRRVLRPGGQLVVSTPNRLTFSPGLDRPANPFHTFEFTAAELAGALRFCGFTVQDMLGLHAGPRLRAADARHGGSVVAAQLAADPADWSARLRDDVAAVTTADFEIGDDDLDAALDLMVIATLH